MEAMKLFNWSQDKVNAFREAMTAPVEPGTTVMKPLEQDGDNIFVGNRAERRAAAKAARRAAKKSKVPA